MPYCTNCGEEMSKSSKYCSTCGEKNALSFPVDNRNQGSVEVTIASSSRRLLNMLIDYTLGAFLSAFILGAILGFLGFTTGYEDDSFWTFLGIVATALYYFFCELFFGKTIGKLITSTKVVMINGEKPTTKAILIRTLTRFVPFEAFSFSGNNPIGWHDKWSNTKVVNG